MRRTVQRTLLLVDGHKALALIQDGKTINDLLMVIPGSRARLYRAMAAASAQVRHLAVDPLTEYNKRKFGSDPLLL